MFTSLKDGCELRNSDGRFQLRSMKSFVNDIVVLMVAFRTEVYDYTKRNYATRKIAPFLVDVL